MNGTDHQGGSWWATFDVFRPLTIMFVLWGLAVLHVLAGEWTTAAECVALAEIVLWVVEPQVPA